MQDEQTTKKNKILKKRKAEDDKSNSLTKKKMKKDKKKKKEEFISMTTTTNDDPISITIDTKTLQEKQHKKKKDKRYKKEKKEKKEKELLRSKSESDINKDTNNDNTTSNDNDNKNKYPYPTDDDDHCETPIEAYQHIIELLEKLCSVLNKTPETLSIWDPYYCTGQMKIHLNKLGYTSIYNKCEDFYITRNNKQPEHDCILTNPPYSEDHMENLVNWCFQHNKPCFLLMPNYVITKEYWLKKEVTQKGIQRICYLAPKNRYLYSTPYGRRQRKSSKFTSPFKSLWYCIFGQEGTKSITLKRTQINPPKTNDSRCIVTISNQLPLEILPENHPQKKIQRNKDKRKKNKARKKNNNNNNNNNGTFTA